ncbi:MAG: DUF177 domain-containing protein [Polyangiaceae bacterium]|nr:DUF177 domain-containing protein [Polyangiaceae bacterium]
MSKPEFSVHLQALEDGPVEINTKLSDNFLNQQLADTDVTAAGEDNGRVDLTLTKTGPNVLVQGSLSAQIKTPCARTLEPADYSIRTSVFLMLSPAQQSPLEEKASRQGPRRQKGRSKAEKGWENDPLLTDQEAAQDTYSGDTVVLDSFLREFILLEIPMVPLREDLRGVSGDATASLPGEATSSEEASSGSESQGTTDSLQEKPLDPRLSPLAELKARLEKKE